MIIKVVEQHCVHIKNICVIYNNVIVICFVRIPVLSHLTGYNENQMTY